MIKKYGICGVLVVFLMSTINTTYVFSATSINLPAPGQMVYFSPPFNPLAFKGMVIYPDNPYKLDFILDQGDAIISQAELNEQSRTMTEYFLASLTTPEKEVWVNLSPFEKERIIPDHFGTTRMGQDLLAQDYMLKQIMATAFYPERKLGKEFWQNVYAQAKEKFGTTDLAFNTFNKVWIVPGKAVVYKNPKMNAVFVVESTLKVMLETDYLAMQKSQRQPGDMLRKPEGIATCPQAGCQASEGLHVKAPQGTNLTQAIIKQIVIPALEQEVNTGKNFAQLRQVYQSLILAKWFKQNLNKHLLGKGFADRNKVLGLKGEDDQMASKIYDQYLKAYRKGVYNYIQEDYDEVKQKIRPRKYFSGGFMGEVNPREISTIDEGMISAKFKGLPLLVGVLLSLAPAVNAQGQRFPANGLSADVNFGNAADIVGATVNGGGDPLAAAKILKEMRFFDATIAGHAAQILRLASNSSADTSLGVTFSFPFGISVEGLGDTLRKGFEFIQQGNDVGNSTLRMQAAAYLARYAGQIQSSGLGGVIFGTGVWESLASNNETNPTVRTARLVALTAMIKTGTESRIGNRITRLDFLETSLKSTDPREKRAAIALLQAIKPGDLDRRFEGLIIQAIQGANVPELAQAANAASKQQMATAIPPLIQRLEKLYTDKPNPSNVVGFINWYGQVYSITEDIAKLSRGNADLMLSALKTLSDSMTGPNATDVVNSVYLGLLYIAVQSGQLDAQTYISELNSLRAGVGLSAVSGGGMSFGKKSDLTAALIQLGKGNDPKRNAQIIAENGGPIFTEALLSILALEPSTETVLAIFTNLRPLVDTGVFARNNKVEQTIIKTLKSNDSYDSMAVDMLDGLSKSGIAVSSGVIRAAVAYALGRANGFSSTMNVSSGALSPIMGYVATISRNSGKTDEAIGFVKRTPTGPDAGANGSQLINALQSMRNVRPTTPNAVGGNANVSAGPRFASTGGTPVPSYAGGGGGFQQAEQVLLAFLTGTSESPAAAINAIIAANRSYKSASDISAGKAILIKAVEQFKGKDDSYKMRLAQVLSGVGDIGFEFLPTLLQSGNVEVDQFVLDLIRKSTPTQQGLAKYTIVDAFIFWLSRRNIQNAASLNDFDKMYGDIVLTLKSIGIPASQGAIDIRLNSVNPAQRLALIQLKSIVASNDDPKAFLDPWRAAFSQIIRQENVAGALSSMMQMNTYPAHALADTDYLIGSSVVQGNQAKITLTQLSRRVMNAFQSNASVIQLEERRDLLSKGLKLLVADAKEGATNVPMRITEIAASAIAMPEAYAQSLFLETIKSMRLALPKFTEDENQWESYFKTLIALRKLMTDAPAEKQTAIMNFMLEDIQSRQGTQDRYNNPELIMFLLSITPAIFDQIGLTYAINPQLFAEPPAAVRWDNTLDSARAIAETKTVLAGQIKSAGLPSSINSSARSQGVQVLIWYAGLLNTANPQKQIDALASAGGYLPLLGYVAPDLHPGSPLAQTAYLYMQAQLKGPRFDIRYKEHAFDSLTPQQQLLMAGLLANSQDPRAYRQMIDTLNDANVWKNNPALTDQIITFLGKMGNPDAVWTLAALFDKYDLISSIPFKTYSDSRAYTIQKAIESIAQVPGNGGKVRQIIESQLSQLANRGNVAGLLTRNNLSSILKNLPDSAQIAPTGGIDLGETDIETKAGQDLPLTYGDSDQLNALMNAGGLIPVIDSIKPITVFYINQLLR